MEIRSFTYRFLRRTINGAQLFKYQRYKRNVGQLLYGFLKFLKFYGLFENPQRFCIFVKTILIVMLKDGKQESKKGLLFIWNLMVAISIMAILKHYVTTGERMTLG